MNTIRTICLILLACGAATARADLMVALDAATARQGESATLTLSLEGNLPVGGLNTRITLPSGVGLDRVEAGALASAAGTKMLLANHERTVNGHTEVALVLASSDGAFSFTSPGVVARLVLTIGPNAPAGKVLVPFVEGATFVAEPRGEATVANTTMDGELTIQPAFLATDINRDGKTNALDVQLVVNAVLGIPIGGLNADVSGDGKTNALDIQRVVNGVLGL